MAKEFLLIPKTKYDALLKQVGNKRIENQSGGERELNSSSEENSDLSETSTKTPAIADRGETPIEPKDNKHPLERGDNPHVDITVGENELTDATTANVKPTLYVERPLSKMPFNSSGRKRKASSPKSKQSKQLKWIKYSV